MRTLAFLGLCLVAACGGGSSDDDDVGGDGDADCDPLAANRDAANTSCEGPGDCPDGYTCHAMNGIVLQLTCEILCTQDCECPDAGTCMTRQDKAGSWMECSWE